MKEIKTVVFVSNFFNHHQKPFSDAMYTELGAGYSFIESSTMPLERKDMGWEMKMLPSYVVSSDMLHGNLREYEEKIYQADVVIFGDAPYGLVKRRIRANKLTFRYSERLLKKGLELWKYPWRWVRGHWLYPQHKNVHLLCASAYAAADHEKLFLFRNRSYKWGYFPETYRYENISELIGKKSKNVIIWVARFLEWKHPEIAVEVGKRLKQNGYRFTLKMIGNGQLLEEITERVRQEGLEDMISVMGAMPPSEVRRQMEQAQIHIFTSDRNEGWGVVLNESMNSACVPVADRNIGSAPFLIQNGENGYTYDGVDDLYEKIKYLLDHNEERKTMAKRAYATITEEWNAEVAAARFLQLSESILLGKPNAIVYGCCSLVK